MKPTSQSESIDDYIAGFPAEIQVLLQQMRQTIHEAAPEATEAISYQMPTFKLHGNLVHFAAFKDHIGFFPAPSGIDAFTEEIAPYRTGKGTLQFSLTEPLPLDLVRRIVLYRVQENTAKAARKGKR
jgi:uncharacterized protein YdhG (YjbR/CyaY superfamily)